MSTQATFVAPSTGLSMPYQSIVDALYTAADNSVHLVPNTDLDLRFASKAAYTFSVATNNMQVYVYGAIKSDFSDEAIISTMTISAGTTFSWQGNQGPTLTGGIPMYPYVRVKTQNTTAGLNGATTVNGWAI